MYVCFILISQILIVYHLSFNCYVFESASQCKYLLTMNGNLTLSIECRPRINRVSAHDLLGLSLSEHNIIAIFKINGI